MKRISILIFLSRVSALIIFPHHLMLASLSTFTYLLSTLTMFRCLPSHLFFSGNSLFSHFQPSSIHPHSHHPSIHLVTRRHSSLHAAYPLSSSYSVHYIHPSSLILSSPVLLYVSHPSASSFTPRANLSSSNSLLAQPPASLNYSGSIICFLFFTHLVFFAPGT